MVQVIQSRQNKTVKEIIALQDKKNRRKQKKFLIEGFRFVSEAVSSGANVEKIVFSAGAFAQPRQELEALLSPDTEIYETPSELFHLLAETESPQGVLAVVHMPGNTLSSVYRKGFRGIVLDSVQDPGNAGTIIRSAHALGFDAVLATAGTVDIFNSKVLRSTMGSVFYVPVVDGLEEEEIFSFSHRNGIQIIASRLEEAKPCHNVDLTGELLIVIGNEGKGVSEELQNHASGFIHIPMPGGAESFNAAVAASILMYESNRQRHAGI